MPKGERRMTARTAALGIAFSALVVGPPAWSQEAGILNLGDAVVTGFSGVAIPDGERPLSTTDIAIDETLIDLDGISARINGLGAPAYIWDGRVWPADTVKEFTARDIGQVFGVTLDDAPKPNIYLTASSAYGLHIVAADLDGDGRPERLKKGAKDAVWMLGMWGIADPRSSAGSIWKVDGETGAVTLFANVLLDNEPNPGPGLGNITYDAQHKQLFVSDLATGMIHHFALDGQELDHYDHGVTGRAAAALPEVAYDPTGRLDIASGDFDSEDPDTWGYADEDRRVWGLAVHEDRLFYAVVGDSQIWSVGLDKDGRFLKDAQWEIDVPRKPKQLPVSDILFTHKGAMVLAQRGEVASTYDYADFASPGKARLYRYWLEDPENPKTPSRWIAEPEEYAVGFEGNNRATDGGIDLNYGYTDDGYLDTGGCEASLWTTGDNLRRNDELKPVLLPGGPQLVDGLQGMPAGPVKDKNTPPWASYMVDNDPTNTELDPDNPQEYSDTATDGWIGDVAIYRTGCSGGDIAGYWEGAGYTWSDPPYITDGGECTPGVDCPEPPPQCAIPAGGFVCDETTGTWLYQLDAGLDPAMQADTVKVTGTSPGITVTNGPEIPLGTPATDLLIGGTLSGQLVSIDLCIFDKSAMETGQPFDCCNTTVTAYAPAEACVKK